MAECHFVVSVPTRTRSGTLHGSRIFCGDRGTRCANRVEIFTSRSDRLEPSCQRVTNTCPAAARTNAQPKFSRGESRNFHKNCVKITGFPVSGSRRTTCSCYRADCMNFWGSGSRRRAENRRENSSVAKLRKHVLLFLTMELN